jgi:hypothetical protein
MEPCTVGYIVLAKLALWCWHIKTGQTLKKGFAHCGTEKAAFATRFRCGVDFLHSGGTSTAVNSRWLWVQGGSAMLTSRRKGSIEVESRYDIGAREQQTEQKTHGIFLGHCRGHITTGKTCKYM